MQKGSLYSVQCTVYVYEYVGGKAVSMKAAALLPLKQKIRDTDPLWPTDIAGTVDKPGLAE